MHAVDDDGVMVKGLGVERSWEHLQIRRAFLVHLRPHCDFRSHFACSLRLCLSN